MAVARIEPSIGSRGDSYDNALAATIIGLLKTEVTHHRSPWKGLEDVELATLCWVSWYNTERLMKPLGCLPPAEYESQYSRAQSSDLFEVGLNELSLRKSRGDSAPSTATRLHIIELPPTARRIHPLNSKPQETSSFLPTEPCVLAGSG